MTSRSGVGVSHVLLISPLPTDFCLRDFQPKSQANLVNSDTQRAADIRDREGRVSGKYPGGQPEGGSSSG